VRRAIAAAIPLLLLGKIARAQSVPSSPGGAAPMPELVDGSTAALLWLPALGSIVLDRWIEPRSTPLYFDRNAGGAPRASWEVPAWSLHVAAAGLGLAMAAGDDDSRWYHIKGLAQAMATSSLVVSALKPLVGRHRPDWTADSTDGARNRSFPSGHTTNAFVIASYAALYLHGRVFDRDSSALLQGAAYGGLALGAIMIAAERAYHDRHHVSDVVVGAVIGTASAYTMFRLQDDRFARRASQEPGGWRLAPGFAPGGATIGLSGAF
jgi:membrane-associated phospholipid phosphatase